MGNEEEERNKLIRERMVLKRILEERKIIDQITSEKTDVFEVMREIKEEKITLGTKRKTSYARIDELQTPKSIEKGQIIIIPPEVEQTFDEIRQLISIPLTQLYEKQIPEQSPNKFTSIRKLSEFLEKGEFNAEEIALLRTLIRKIVEKNEGSLEKVLLALLVESKI